MFDVDDYTCEDSNRGKDSTEPFSRNEFLNKKIQFAQLEMLGWLKWSLARGKVNEIYSMEFKVSEFCWNIYTSIRAKKI